MATLKETLEAEIKGKQALIDANVGAISGLRNSFDDWRARGLELSSTLPSFCPGDWSGFSFDACIAQKTVIPESNRTGPCLDRVREVNKNIQTCITRLSQIEGKQSENALLKKEIEDLQKRINELPESKQAMVAANTNAQIALTKEQGRQRVITIVATVLALLVITGLAVWWFKFRKN